MRGAKIFKYELKNILRSRLIVVWSVLLFLLAVSFIKISGDFAKAVLAMFSVLSVVIPLVSMLFTAIYWYYSDRFTQLLLTMPVHRSEFFWARWWAIAVALSGSLLMGMLPAFAFYTGLSSGLFFASGLAIFLVVVFASLGLLVATLCTDRMKGVGLLLALWLYFVLVHDGLLLVLLGVFKDYPLDTASAVVASLNPIGLMRVVLVMQFDAPLLLSHTGALVRRMVTSWEAYGAAPFIAVIWILVPALFAYARFRRCDF